MVVNKKGETLLHLACRLCKPQIVHLLLLNDLGNLSQNILFFNCTNIS